MERINSKLYENKSENWGPSLSINGATPGEQNSIYSDLTIRTATIEIQPNPFSPDEDGFEDHTIISGEIPDKSARIKIQIFDIKGRKIRTLNDNAFTGSKFNVVWDGKNEDNQFARMGIYIVFAQILNDRNGIIRELKSTVVLAHKL
jgi:flagellar hook assembly protein FlgD